MKRFYVQNNIGMAKYLVSYHDGKQKHSDGSDFFGIKIFKNKKKLAQCIADLESNGYVETRCNL